MDILEGRICVLAALQARRRRFEEVLVRQGTKDESISEILRASEDLGVPVRRVRGEALDHRAHGKTHGGVIAVAEPLPPAAAPAAVDLALLIDGVDDARNLGNVLRTAEAFGVQAVFVRRRAWDFDGGDVSRASSGAYERLPVVVCDVPPEAPPMIGLAEGAGTAIYDLDLTRPVLLAVGGEKRGLSAAVRDRCRALASIPTRPGAPSLSLAHAAAVSLAEAARQRRATP